MITKVMLEFVAGVNIEAACREAKFFATSCSHPVSFMFNDTEIRVSETTFNKHSASTFNKSICINTVEKMVDSYLERRK